MLPTKEIAEQLEESFNLLTGGSRTALPRQQTIRASIEWSWNLLSDDERILMRQLSVFVGGWTFEFAQAVCDGDVLGLTSSLVKKSLIAVKQAHPSSIEGRVVRRGTISTRWCDNTRAKNLSKRVKSRIFAIGT